MIKSLKLHNFKCYSDSEILFRKLTVFSGRNGAGKSTALQALNFLRQNSEHYMNSLNRGTPKFVSINGQYVSFGTIDDLIYYMAPRTTETIVSLELHDDSERSMATVVLRRPDRGYDDLSDLMLIDAMTFREPSVLFGDMYAYLGADRLSPRSSYDYPTQVQVLQNFIGARGEWVAWLLSKTSGARLEIPDFACDGRGALRADGARPTTIQEVGFWMSKMGTKIGIVAEANDHLMKAGFRFSFFDENGRSQDYRPENVGFGLSYSLPIYVALLSMAPGAIAIIENPESHLHPQGQVEIGRFIAKAASLGVQVIVETHSDHVLNGIRLSVKERVISGDDVQLNFVTKSEDHQSASLLMPRILPSGAIDVWPDGFFDAYEKTLLNLI